MELRLLGLAAAASAAVAFAGCTSVRVSAVRPSHSYPDAHAVYSVRGEATVAIRAGTFRYRYFPRVQVYFAPDRAVYYWLEDGTWCTGRVLPPGLAFRPSEGVDITLEVDVPYIEHDRVRAAHGGERGWDRRDEHPGKGPGNDRGLHKGWYKDEPGTDQARTDDQGGNSQHTEGNGTDQGNDSGKDNAKDKDNGNGRSQGKGKGQGQGKGKGKGDDDD